MTFIANDHDLITDSTLARRLRVTVGWLKAEAEAGRIPHLHAGRRLLFSEEAVREVLTRRAATEGLQVKDHA